MCLDQSHLRLDSDVYAVTFMMEKRFVQVYSVVRKEDVLSNFMEFRQYMETHADVSVRTICSDNGGECTSTDMKTWCTQEFTIPHNPQQNGMAERANRTLVEMALYMLRDSGMEITF